MIKIIIDSQYHRNQFDDYLAGGEVEYKRKTYYWSARDSNYGFGWEVEQISEDNWSDLSENEFSKIISLIEKCLYEHKTEYVF
jgi:hypothetical protein